MSCSGLINGQADTQTDFIIHRIAYKTLNGSIFLASDDLDSSLFGGNDIAPADSSDREGRIVAATLKFTSSSTVTVTVTSTDSSTTFSVSYFCTVAGVDLFPVCG